jgi:hypothetical protein
VNVPVWFTAAALTAFVFMLSPDAGLVDAGAGDGGDASATDGGAVDAQLQLPAAPALPEPPPQVKQAADDLRKAMEQAQQHMKRGPKAD